MPALSCDGFAVEELPFPELPEELPPFDFEELLLPELPEELPDEFLFVDEPLLPELPDVLPFFPEEPLLPEPEPGVLLLDFVELLPFFFTPLFGGFNFPLGILFILPVPFDMEGGCIY